MYESVPFTMPGAVCSAIRSRARAIPKSRELHVAVEREQDVLRRYVAMDDGRERAIGQPALVRGREPAQHAQPDRRDEAPTAAARSMSLLDAHAAP